MSLLPFFIIIVAALLWKILVPFWAVSCILFLVIASSFAYLFRSGGVEVRQEGILLHTHRWNLSVGKAEINQAYLAQRRGGAYVYTLTNSSLPSSARVLTLPPCVPTFFFLKNGVVIERKGQHTAPGWNTATAQNGVTISSIFIPSAQPEQLLKAIQDFQHMS